MGRIFSGRCAASLGSTPSMAAMLLTPLVHGPLTIRRSHHHFGTIAANHKDAPIAASYVPARVLRWRNDSSDVC
jgi:hypothetical protein